VDSFDNWMNTVVVPAGAQGIITVNYGSNPANNAGGDTNVAAAWVQYANVTEGRGIKYWEIGNEIGGNGYYGTNLDWEYDLHYPETNAATRVGQPALSPAAYGTNSIQFIGAMKAKDHTIKCGVGFDTGNPTYNSQLLGVCGSVADFVVIHWYPGGNVLAATAQIPGIVANTFTQLTNIVGAAHAAQMQIAVTETGAGNATGAAVSLFAADDFLTWIENGIPNVDYEELHNDILMPDETPGHAYYGAQMAHFLANVGDSMLTASSDQALVRVHASVRQDGAVGVMVLNTDAAQTNTVNLNFTGTNLTSSGVRYQFGMTNFIGTNDNPSYPVSSNVVSGLGNQFSVVVPPYTIINFIIPIKTNTPPVLAAIGNQTVNVGQTVAFTAVATDTNVPAPTLTYSIQSGPTNATINPSTGAFSWRPLVSQGGATSSFVIKVSDGGTPVLSATQSFSVTVNALVQPALTAVSSSGSQIRFTISGVSGPDYEVQVSTNLVTWNTVFTTNSPPLPISWTDTGAGSISRRFYRLGVGPPLP
jgi:hypothetical protein